jgi:hypothetical protein
MKFKCLLSGNIVEFTSPHDIKTTQDHPQYEEVVETETKPTPAKPKAKS